MKYHFIGDQGISMSGIKEYLEVMGNIVTGSDLKTSGHNAKNITEDIDLVVRSSAINPGSKGWCEVEEAHRLGVKVVKRSELLGEITKDKKLIAVSGMHGKTTVTALAGLVLVEAGLDPTVLVGERVKQFDNDVLHVGKSNIFLMEACEYDRSFLDFNPDILILTNIEEEHLDTYPGGLPEIKEAFIEYINRVPDNGLIIACHDDRNIIDVLGRINSKAKILYYGANTDYSKLSFPLSIPGEHNKTNALAVVALAKTLEINDDVIKKVFAEFRGANRRFEYKGTYNEAVVIDDYGHHPTEIRATIEALYDKYSGREKYVVFWPHQYKRIKPLINQFVAAFDRADHIILKPIYLVPGRDEKLDVSSEDIERLLKENGKDVIVIDDDNQILEYLKSKIDRNSVVLTIGIPPIYKVAEELVKS